MALVIGAPSGFTVTDERPLFSATVFRSDNMHKMYEVLPDNRGFLFVRNEDVESGKMILVQNWRRAVEQRRGRQR